MLDIKRTDLTILKSSSGNLVVSSCDRYTTPKGAMFKTATQFKHYNHDVDSYRPA